MLNPTTVVCIKVANIRPEYNNLKEWMQDPNNVYIGRKGIVFIDGERFPKFDSMWANPFKITNDLNRQCAISQYKNYIIGNLDRGTITYEQLMSLKGKRLGCWCHPNLCHGDVLVELINECNK